MQLNEKSSIQWLKDNKPLDDRLADRIVTTEKEDNSYRLELKHCSESDSGTYTARATNGNENSTCTAQLIVEKCKRSLMTSN